MKKRALLLTAVLALSSLHASRVMDDETLLRDPDRYNPHPKQDRMVQFTVKKSGVDFCIHQGQWTVMKDDLCEPEESLLDRMKQAAERTEQLRAAKERLKKMTRDEWFEFKKKQQNELLTGAHFLRWYGRDSVASH